MPLAGRWREVLNTDSEAYGGSNQGNLGKRGGRADRVAWAAVLGVGHGPSSGRGLAGAGGDLRRAAADGRIGLPCAYAGAAVRVSLDTEALDVAGP